MSENIGNHAGASRSRFSGHPEKIGSISKSSSIGKGLNLTGFVVMKKDIEIDPKTGEKRLIISGTLDTKLYISQCPDCGVNLHIKDYKKTRLLNGRVSGNLSWVELLRIKQQCPKCRTCYMPEVPFRVGEKRYTINVIHQITKIIERIPDISNSELSKEVGIGGAEVGNIRHAILKTPKRSYVRTKGAAKADTKPLDVESTSNNDQAVTALALNGGEAVNESLVAASADKASLSHVPAATHSQLENQSLDNTSEIKDETLDNMSETKDETLDKQSEIRPESVQMDSTDYRRKPSAPTVNALKSNHNAHNESARMSS